GFYKAQQGSLFLQTPQGPVSLLTLLGEKLTWQHWLQPEQLLQRIYYKMFGGPHRINRVGVARTFQNIRLFREMTALENLLVAQHQHLNTNLLSGLFDTAAYRRSEEAALQKAWAMLAKVGLGQEGNRLAGTLPYGSQRRLEIARALCSSPRLLCLDEPAAGLNPQETRELSLLLQTIRQEMNLTILLIEHDMELVMGISDHVVVLDHGEVIAQGGPEEIRRNQRVLEAYLGIPDEEDWEA
ncbi:MAG: ATP-binding cassette domain-containing protein, partial [Magnetococcales bacterium]|nr:ATP-binding cassette domain-containing protein [Magnetococcales bacterium]